MNCWMSIIGLMINVEIFFVFVLGGYYVNVYIFVNLNGEIRG